MHYLENVNDNKRAKLASQAYDEGSIPFTRSSKISDLNRRHIPD
jgi:hypothetical protein